MKSESEAGGLLPLNTDPYPCPLQDKDRGDAAKVKCIRENFLARQCKHPQGRGYLTEEESEFLLNLAEGHAESVAELKQTVAELEEKLEDKDEEIVELQGKVEDLGNGGGE